MTSIPIPIRHAAHKRSARTILRVILATLYMILIAATPKTLLATTTGFFVDGGYSPGKTDSDMDKTIDKRLKEAEDILKSKDPAAQTGQYKSKAEFLKALENTNCKCGDEIVVYMMGHGRPGGKLKSAFMFTKDGEGLEPEELRKALTKAAKECCCKIHVVVFSCHSGMFLDELFKEEHVMSVYTSSAQNEQSYADAYYDGSAFVDNGDWAAGFNKDWKKDTTTGSFKKALENSSRSAREEMPQAPAGKSQTPQGWSRGEHRALAHVSARSIDKNKKILKLTITFREPIFLRGVEKEIDVRDVRVPDSVKRCMWIEFDISTGKPKDAVKAVSEVKVVSAPTENILAHIEAIGDNSMTLLVLEPKHLYRKIIIVKVLPPAKIDKSKLRVCNWIRQKITILDPDSKSGYTTSDNPVPHEQSFICKIHVSNYIQSKGEIEAHLLEPAWLHCTNKTFIVPPNERAGLGNLKQCMNLVLHGVYQPNGQIDASNVRVIRFIESNAYSIDASMNAAHQPEYNEQSRCYYPSIGLTNTGTTTINADIQAVLCRLEDRSIIDSWWKSGGGLPTSVWQRRQHLTQVPFAQTQVVEFDRIEQGLAPGDYWIGYKSMVQGDENPSSDTSSVVFHIGEEASTLVPGNHAPVLSNLDLQPTQGLSTTRFRFRIRYQDEDGHKPSHATVLIDNMPFAMTASTTDYKSGVDYQYETTLDSGIHKHRFEFADGYGEGVQTDEMTGPLVNTSSTNSAPTIQQGNVNPGNGTQTTMFKYTVVYTDVDGDMPSQAQVIVDGQPFQLQPTSTNARLGIRFETQRNLGTSAHTFRFHFDDGHGHVVDSPPMNGPIVK